MRMYGYQVVRREPHQPQPAAARRGEGADAARRPRAQRRDRVRSDWAWTAPATMCAPSNSRAFRVVPTLDEDRDRQRAAAGLRAPPSPPPLASMNGAANRRGRRQRRRAERHGADHLHLADAAPHAAAVGRRPARAPAGGGGTLSSCAPPPTRKKITRRTPRDASSAAPPASAAAAERQQEVALRCAHPEADSAPGSAAPRIRSAASRACSASTTKPRTFCAPAPHRPRERRPSRCAHRGGRRRRAPCSARSRANRCTRPSRSAAAAPAPAAAPAVVAAGRGLQGRPARRRACAATSPCAGTRPSSTCRFAHATRLCASGAAHARSWRTSSPCDANRDLIARIIRARTCVASPALAAVAAAAVVAKNFRVRVTAQFSRWTTPATTTSRRSSTARCGRRRS